MRRKVLGSLTGIWEKVEGSKRCDGKTTKRRREGTVRMASRLAEVPV